MKDPISVLEKRGPNTRNAGMIRFLNNGQVAETEPMLTSSLAKAVTYADAGIKSSKLKANLLLADELSDAFDAGPALTQGRQ